MSSRSSKVRFLTHLFLPNTGSLFLHSTVISQFYVMEASQYTIGLVPTNEV